ncbi:hypothetical protein F4780DRAFT_19404 [Xylariomycetidae sp. FL0641]|nr:hypothetical protein F4780DRAFT_19404 [Xylariomycetidae sp. FL0641]
MRLTRLTLMILLSTMPKLPPRATLELPLSTFPKLPLSTFPKLPLSTFPKLPLSTFPKLPLSTLPNLPLPTLPNLPLPTLPTCHCRHCPTCHCRHFPSFHCRQCPICQPDRRSVPPIDTTSSSWQLRFLLCTPDGINVTFGVLTPSQQQSQTPLQHKSALFAAEYLSGLVNIVPSIPVSLERRQGHKAF